MLTRNNRGTQMEDLELKGSAKEKGIITKTVTIMKGRVVKVNERWHRDEIEGHGHSSDNSV